jgi:hydrocephalus-inducing protein
MIEGLEQPLQLTLTGAAINDQVAGTLAFSCCVRSTVSKNITIKNVTASDWYLKPVIQNSFWTGAEFLRVPANGAAEYRLDYHPLTTAAASPHTGSVFFPIPDGSGLLYRLEGIATEPKAAETITRCAAVHIIW